MGGFAIIPKKENITERVILSFKKRDFRPPIKFENRKNDILYFPKFNGVEQYEIDNDGNVLLLIGTLWYKNNSFEKIKRNLLNEFRKNKIDERLLSGTYSLIFFNKDENKINILHDANGVYRFYYDKSSKIISSSWLSLTWLNKKEKSDINFDAVFENLILGFNIGNKTFVNSILRVNSNVILPEEISYRQSKVVTDEHSKAQSFLNSVHISNNKLLDTLNPKLGDYNQITLGVSGGHDSRLLLGTIENSILKKNLNLFTFYKPNDKDLEIAQDIAGVLGKKIKIVKTQRPNLKKEQEKIFEEAFHFFDGQCGTMLQFSKEDYTKRFRDRLFNNNELHLSGVGGEIFRNYNHQPKNNLEMNFWIDQFFCSGKLKSLVKKVELIDKIIEELKNLLSLDTERINYKKRKFFYGHIFLNNWHGIRNTIENQYTNYYSPFTDSNLINYSYETINFHGYGGEYETEMINKLSPKLASIKNEYGYDFTHIPIKNMMLNKIKSIVKTPKLSFLRNLKQRKVEPVKLTEFEKDIFYKFSRILDDNNIDTEMFLNLKKEQVLMVSYTLNNILNQYKANEY